jgi:pyrimidine deaminase RibD-like protein
VDANIKHYADTLYTQSMHKSVELCTKQRGEFLQRRAAQKHAANLPFSGTDMQALTRFHVQHIERCMEAKLESYSQAYKEVSRVPSEAELNEILRDIQDTQKLQIRHSAEALQRFIMPRGIDADLSESLTAMSAQGHDRVLLRWKVWHGQVRLRKVPAMERNFEDPYPTTLNDVQAEIDYWASRQHEGQPGSDFDKDVRKRLKHLRHLHGRYVYQAEPSGKLKDSDDRRFARMALEEAKQSVAEDYRVHPKVGVVIVKEGEVLSTAHRGESLEGHAEYIALEKKLTDAAVAGATVYTTLEPCTTRNHPKIPCVERLIERKVARVVIGMLDPNPSITGRGQRKLRDANIVTELFPHDLMSEVEELNREFTRTFGSASISVESTPLAVEPTPAETLHTTADVGLEHERKSGIAKALVQVRVLRIVIASPSDVTPERNMVLIVLEEINKSLAVDRGLRLEAVRWETDTYPGFHLEGPQSLIDPILQIEDCDVVVGIFWKRFGTPTPSTGSGTAHELRRAYEGWKARGQPHVMVYFNQKSYTPQSKEETDQWGQVLEFRKAFPKEGLWWSYKGKAEFEKLLRVHLTNFIRSKFPLTHVESEVVNQSSEVADYGALLRELGTVAIDMQPDVWTWTFAEKFNALDRYIDGSAIEIHSNFNLEGGFPLGETGWAPHKVPMLVLDGDFDTREVLADESLASAFERSEQKRIRDGKAPVLNTYNGRKYSIVSVPPNVPERDDLTLGLRKTDYFSVMRALPGILQDPQKRCVYGHVDPSLNRVPNSLGLHFLAVLQDGEVLAIHRDKNLDYDAGTWSFSGEEQCFPSDLAVEEDARTKHYLLRTAVEEVFPLGTSADDEQLQLRIQFIKPFVRSMRIWSVILQEPCLTFSIFGVFEFILSRKRYKELCDDLLRKRCGKISGEGRYYTVALADTLRLLQGQPINASPLFGGEQVSVSPAKLHPTSRYRLSRFLAVLARGRNRL